MSDNVFNATPRQTRKMLITAFEAGLVPMVHGHPGIGKSALLRSIAEEVNLHLIDHRISTASPEDATGIPRFQEDGTVAFSPITEIFPIQKTPMVPGTNGWLLFLDEINSARPFIQAPHYKIILDRMTGQHKLHDNVFMAAAGNMADSRAIVYDLSSALQSRMVHIFMETNTDEWIEDVAIPQDYDKRIIAFLLQYPSKLMTFNPSSGDDRTFCSPRTWEFVNRIIKNKESIDLETQMLLGGTITHGIAMEFVKFTELYKSMVNIVDVVKDPEGCKIPDEVASKWATVQHLMEMLDKDNFGPVCEYIDRYDLSMRIMFFRFLARDHREFQSHDAFKKSMLQLARYLNG